MSFLNIQRVFLCALVSITFAPYVASFMRVSEALLYEVEIIAILFWYLTSLAIPLFTKEIDTALVIWCFTFILVSIVIGSDTVYHMTGISPDTWYDELGRLTRRYYSFMKTWVLTITPGCALFLITSITRKASRKIES